MKNPVVLLRLLVLVEAVSFLVLLGIAMPLKYAWDMPVAVQITGWIHGVLFLLFCWALVRVAQGARWPSSRIVGVFVAAIVPIVPFLMDKRMRAWAAEWNGATAP